MKTFLRSLLMLVAFATLNSSVARADDLAALAGKWVATRTDDQGRSGTMVIEIKQSKFTFKVLRDGQVVLYAEGDVKADMAGPLKTAKFYNIQGGRSQFDLSPVDDERTVVYTLSNDELTVAANFDRERSEAPNLTVYKKAAEEGPKTLVIDKIAMLQTPQSAEWYLCFEATVEGVTKRFNLPNKAFDKNNITIETDLAIPDVRPGQTCKFVMKLDDVSGDECTEEMDDRSTGSFTVTAEGSQAYKPEDQWSYTIYWHLK